MDPRNIGTFARVDGVPGAWSYYKQVSTGAEGHSPEPGRRQPASASSPRRFFQVLSFVTVLLALSPQLNIFDWDKFTTRPSAELHKDTFPTIWIQ